MALGKRIINVDQSPIGNSNLYEKIWMPKDIYESKPIHIIFPRITMMAAIDNFGEIYYEPISRTSTWTI